MFGVAHSLSYLPNPHRLGTHLHAEGPSCKVEVKNALFNTPDDDMPAVTQEPMDNICTAYMEFVISATYEEKTNLLRYKCLMKGVSSPLDFQYMDKNGWLEPHIQLLSIATSSVASENNF